MNELMNNTAAGKLVLRLMLGILLMFHGVARLLHPGTIDFISGTLTGAGLPGFIAYGVYVGEIIAPLMIILGVYSRIGALLVVINMVFAVLLVHAGDLFSVTEHGGWRLELQAFYLFSGLAIMFLGSGRLAGKPV